jgi:hypothetical protein
VAKTFADWVYAFADRGKQSAKRRFPVVDGPFTDEEILSVVSYMPLDQAPGRDGFNGFFYKKC